MIFSKFLEKMHPLRGGSLPPSRWSLSSAALSPSLLISPPLALDSLASDARSLELPPDLLGRRDRQVSSSFLVHGSVAIGAGRLHPRSKKTWERNCMMMMLKKTRKSCRPSWFGWSPGWNKRNKSSLIILAFDLIDKWLGVNFRQSLDFIVCPWPCSFKQIAVMARFG